MGWGRFMVRVRVSRTQTLTLKLTLGTRKIESQAANSKPTSHTQIFYYFMLCIYTSVETYLASWHAAVSADDVGFDTSVIKSLQLSLYQ